MKEGIVVGGQYKEQCNGGSHVPPKTIKENQGQAGRRGIIKLLIS